MRKSIYRLALLGSCLASLNLLPACTSSSEGKQAQSEEQHSDEEGGQAFLTHANLKAAGIRIGHLEYKELSATIRANGYLKVPKSEKGFASSLYGGIIQRFFVHQGEVVHKGQTVALITNPQFIQTQEDYLTTLSKLTYAEQEVRRQEALQSGDAGIGKQLQSAKAELSSLRSRKASLAQQLRLMGISVDKLSASNLRTSIAVTSPVDGVVGELLSQIGAYVDPSTPICEIINNKALHLDLNVYEQDLPKLKIGQKIHFRLTNNPSQEYDAEIHTIGGTFEPNSRSIAVHCKLLGNTTGFIDGMSTTGLISIGEVLTPALPDDAIVNYEGKDYVFVQLSDDPSHSHEHDYSSADSAKTNAHAEETIEANRHSESRSDHIHAEGGHRFRRIPVLRGASALGYTAVTFFEEIPRDAYFVLSGAFFVNAVLTPNAGHSHAH